MEKHIEKKLNFGQLLTESLLFCKNEFSSWGSMFRLLVFIIVLVSFLCIALLITVRMVKNYGFQWVTANGSIIKIGSDTKIQQYLIDPRQPNATKIELNKGDVLKISISGSIHIALGRIIQTLMYEYKIKDSIEMAIGSRNISNFNQDQKIRSLVGYVWNGPSGIDTEMVYDINTRNSISKSLQYRILPGARVGQLIAFISENRDKFSFDPLDTENIIPFNGESVEFKVKKRGYLWFIINDDFYKNDNILNQITMQDNLGFFNATIAINSF